MFINQVCQFLGWEFLFQDFFKNMHKNTSLERSNLVHVDHVLDPPPPLWADMDNWETPLPPLRVHVVYECRLHRWVIYLKSIITNISEQKYNPFLFVQGVRRDLWFLIAQQQWHLWSSMKNISTIIHFTFCSYINFFPHQTQSQGRGTLLLGSRGLKTENSTFSKKPFFLSFGSPTWEQ